MKRNFGWLPDLPDSRDFCYGALRMPARILPESVDLRSKFSPVEDQGSIGSCTANALAGALELLDKADGGTFVNASRLQIYFDERIRMGIQYKYVDSGAFLRDGVKVCASGYASENIWPYVPSKFAVTPSPATRKDALKRKITAYYRISNLNELKDALAKGIPVVFGFSVYSSMMTDAVSKTGIVPTPSGKDTMQGGHAVCAAGYDDRKGVIIFRNSWGTSWGNKGYGFLPYLYVETRNLSDDFWAIVRREEDK